MEVKKEAKYKKTDLGVIPADWKVLSLKDIGTIKTGSKNTQDKIENGLFPFFVRSQTIERINSYSFDGEAILTAGDGVGVGKVFHYINGKFDCHQRVYRITDFPSEISAKFVFLYFRSHFYNRIMQMTAKSSVDSVRMDMIADMQIPVPPTMEEQTAIAKALHDTDTVINNLEKLIAKKQLIKQGALQQLLKTKNGWEIKKLGDIGECIIGLTYTPENVKEVGTLVLRSSNIQGNSLSYSDNVYVDSVIPEKLVNKENDLLICVRNGSRNLIGKCALLKGKAVGQTFGAFMSVFRSPYNEFIFALFQSDIIKKQIDEHLGATINQITNKSLNSFEVPFPGESEQREITNILSDIDSEIKILENKLVKYQQIKQAMTQSLLTGKVRLI